ncbi:acyl-CoA dehydrogenase family protein [Sphingopyxis kveilinensis]|uniref:acyl-CoA dehydrogenase family protein n=1 Tax=Sphingopyxis kveilinensis TaxID=3114367 RepID=UPI0030CF6E47
MKIFDPSVLRLPLYEERHRQLADRIEKWADEIASEPDEIERRSPAETGRHLTTLFGRNGWYGDADAPPDFRSICLVREGFAFVHDLFDFAFSIQALAATPLIRYGSAQQRAALLPDILAGRSIGCLAISEPDVGSDIAHVSLRAERRGDSYVLNGTKTWISNADIADFAIVLARTADEAGPLGLSLFYVPAASPGMRVSETIETMAPRSFGSLSFEGCVVAADQMIGKPGHGFAIAGEILEQYRVTVGAAATGFARRARSAALRWAHARRLGAGTVWDMQLTKSKLADSEAALTASALLVAQAAWEIDHQIRGYGKHCSIAKLFATEQAQRIVDDAVQIFGAAGIVKNAVPERLYRQIRSLRIYEGTSEVQRLIIAGHLQNPETA